MNPGLPRGSALALLAVLVGLSVGACSGNGAVPAAPSSVAGQPPAWVADREVELGAAADRGYRWLISQGSDLPPYVPLLLDHMQRRFGLELSPEIDAVARQAAESGETAAQMRVYLRLLDPEVVITEADLAGLTDEVDRITGPALACDQVALPADYVALLQRAVDLGGYERTHAVLALQWLREHGCIADDAATDLSGRWAEALVESVEAERVSDNGAGDLAIEAMAMLAYTGHADRIEQAWVAHVLAAQNPDGWWPHGINEEVASPHATVLAVWLLTQLAHPDMPQQPWIPQP